MIDFRHSFTLIELLVVIAIIGILAGILIVSMSGATDQATLAKAKVFSSSMRDSMAQSIISEWKFDGSGVADDANATTEYMRDTWGTNSASTIYSNPLVESGNKCIYGSCLSFDGVDDYISYGNVTIDLTHGYTVSTWVKYDTLTGDRGVMRRYSSADNAWFIFGFRNAAASANNIQSYISYTDTSNTSKNITTTVSLKENNWYYLVLTVGSDGIAKFYVNGALGSTAIPVNFLKLGGNASTNVSPTSIGGNYWFMDGLIDETRIYNIPIPFSQIKQQYYAGLQELFTNKGITQDEYNQRLADLDNYCLAIK